MRMIGLAQISTLLAGLLVLDDNVFNKCEIVRA
jgi:hypothetical protein